MSALADSATSGWFTADWLSADWLSALGVVAFVAALALLTYDRRRLERRLHAAEGRAAGLGIELAASREKVDELFGYLREHDNWATDGPVRPVPARPLDLGLAGRWSLPAPGIIGARAQEASASGADLPAEG